MVATEGFLVSKKSYTIESTNLSEEAAMSPQTCDPKDANWCAQSQISREAKTKWKIYFKEIQ